MLLFGVAGVIEARRLPVGDARHPGPGFFPLWLAIALCVVSAALLLQRVPAPAHDDTAPSDALRRDKVVLTLLAGFGYAFVVELLGFTATTFVFLCVLLTTIERQRWIASVAISALTATGCYVVFKIWLAVQLPVGPWGF